ncbi:MAG TPA: SRPBCC family protein [Thermoanaerobaculia bacterium]|nr:SRPBCC family protein [Thermoanaerobaculia bacterium]
MQRIVIDTWIAGPIERCFDAARDLDLHVRSAAQTNERAVGGRLSGLIELGEEVTWRARHFGITQHFTARITAFDRPRCFQDTMQRGAFRSFVHDHTFVEERGGTTMTDVAVFAAPLGVLGWIAERLVLRAYMTRFLTRRAQVLKEIVEAGY